MLDSRFSILEKWKTVICFILSQLISFCLLAQEKYPILTNIISFNDLKKKSFEKKIDWKNSNGSPEEINILVMPIPFDEGMKKQTKEFVHQVYGLDSIWLNPKMIVFHAMGDGDLKTSLEVSSFLNDQIPTSWGNLSKAGSLSNGVHFIIDRDGTIICLSPPVLNDGVQISFERSNHRWFIKRHQDGNPVAIGIENVTDKNNYTDLTHEQLSSNAKLARWLIWFENGKIEFITSHHLFNDDKSYDRFLNYFDLQNLKKQFRTTGRKDIGENNLTGILKQINAYKIPVKSFFD
jgi:hypothetical protein